MQRCRGARARLARACLLGIALLLTGTAIRAQPVAIEFFHAGFGHYFITTNPAEAANLDSGRTPGWARTGEQFAVGGSNVVCRFFSDRYAPKSSHFYTHYAPECNALRVGFVWQFEDLVFSVDVPDASGSCRSGTRPLYRLYNASRGGAPNHRYTVRSDVAAAMRAQGWVSEGIGSDAVFACVPGSAEPPPAPPKADLTVSAQLAAGVRVLTDAEAALITSMTDQQALLSQGIGLSEHDVFVVAGGGAYRVTAVSDEGRTLSITEAGLDEVFSELEIDGTVPLVVPDNFEAKSDALPKAYVETKPRVYTTFLDGQWGVKAELKLLASCGAASFEFVDVKVGVYGSPKVKASLSRKSYEISPVRVVAETALKLGCRLKSSANDRVWVNIAIPTSSAIVILRLEIGGSVQWDTDIPGVVQLASAKVDGTVDPNRSPAFDAKVNGQVFDKDAIVKQIAGTVGLTYVGRIYPNLFGRLVVNVLRADVVGLRVRTGPEFELKAVLTAAPKVCATLDWRNEVWGIYPRLSRPYGLAETLLFRNDVAIPTDLDLDCTTPPPPPPSGATGPTGNWLFTRQSCEMSPVACGSCPATPLAIRMNEATGGATIGWQFPDFPGDPGMTVTRNTDRHYQGCYEPIPGYVNCAAIVLDLPQKRTATMDTSLVFGMSTGFCHVNANWQGTIQ